MAKHKCMLVKMPQMSAQHGHGCRNKAPMYICTKLFREFHQSKRITMAETGCESVEAKEALNSRLGLVCSLLTSTGECLIKNQMLRNSTRHVQVLPLTIA